MGKALVITTRRSSLAKAQTALAIAHLRERLPEASFEVLELTTTGDQQTQWSLERQGGKGLFTKELEDALLDGRADVAVHSAKDLPTELPEGLVLAGFLPRAQANDVLVRREDVAQPKLIATSSPRRRAQGTLLWPGAKWTEIRGNVETRLRKIVEGQADATLLAAAGLARLGITSWPGLVFEHLDLSQMVPAAGQAAIALETRVADAETYGALLDTSTHAAVTIERGLLDAFGGGCQTAVAAHWSEGVLHVFHHETGRHRFELAPLAGAELATALADIIAKVRKS